MTLTNATGKAKFIFDAQGKRDSVFDKYCIGLLHSVWARQVIVNDKSMVMAGPGDHLTLREKLGVKSNREARLRDS